MAHDPRWRLCCLALIALLGLPASAKSASAESSGPDLVQNGGFEDGPTREGDPAVWHATRVREFRDQYAFTWEDSVVHTGARAVAIELLETHPDDIVHYNWNQHLVGFEIGRTYEASAWTRTEDLGRSAFVVLQCWDRAMQNRLALASNQDKTSATGTTDWTRITATIEVPEGTGRMVILVGLAANENRGGKVWFDDVQVVPVGAE